MPCGGSMQRAGTRGGLAIDALCCGDAMRSIVAANSWSSWRALRARRRWRNSSDDTHTPALALSTALDVDVRDAQPERGHRLGLLWCCRGSGFIECSACGGEPRVFGAVGEEAVMADAH